MRLFRVPAVLVFAAILFSFTSMSMALDEAGEEEYQKARLLLKEEKIAEAKSIFTNLLNEDPSNFRVRLGLIDTTLEEARIFKASKNAAWESKVYAAFNELKGIYRANATSPEIFVSFARCYSMNNRFQKATKSLKKAFYYSPGNTEALIAKGDIYFERSKTVEVDPFEDKGRTETSNARNTAAKSYQEALDTIDSDMYTKAMVNYKLGELHSYHGNNIKGKEYYSKALELSPDSYWGERSRMKLSQSK